MYISKFRAALVVMILSSILGVGSVIAQLVFSVRIPSSGSIGPLPPITPGRRVAYESEIRAVFYKVDSMLNPSDWDAVMDTLLTYDINTIVLEMFSTSGGHYDSDYLSVYRDDLGPAIAAAKPRGMKVYVSMDVMLDPPNSTYYVETSAGDGVHWLCPTKEVTRTLVKLLVEEVAANYDIDGFMFDYVRYETADVCYCPECRAKFEEWLGEGPITDWTLFYPTGSRYNEFMEWRSHPINDLVGDMRSWMLAIKPNLEFSAAVWGWPPGAPTYNRYWIAQDSAYWVKEGYLDWVAPMMYTKDVDAIRSYLLEYHERMTAGPEGAVPLVAFLATAWPPPPPDTTNFKQQVDVVREVGADGWIIFSYGGPGEGYSFAPDIRPYLEIIDHPPVFSIKNIDATATANSLTITWTTDLPATSKVEYGTSPLFTANFVYHDIVDFHYWDIDHVPGSIVEDATPVTEHSITLTGLTPGTRYYFRVQSQGSGGIANSKVYTFEL